MPYTSSNGSGQYTANQQNAIARRANIPSINKYLAGDSSYLSQLSGLKKNLSGFETQNLSDRDRTKQDYSTAFDRMKMQRGDDLDNLQGDFASRGILTSGLYTGAVGNYDTKYQQQYGDLTTDKQRKLDDLLNQFQQYKSENMSSAQQAKADAIRRRAMQYGIT